MTTIIRKTARNNKAQELTFCTPWTKKLISHDTAKNLQKDGVSTRSHARVEQIQKHSIKARQVNAIVIYKLDRLSRRVIDTLNLVEFMRRQNIEFHSITDNIDTKTAIGKFFLNVMASLAQMERDLISERTKDALQYKISRHERAGQIPYGWMLAKDGKTLIQKEEEQMVITIIKIYREECLSYRSICRRLTAKDIKPIGKQWHPQTIKNTYLANQVYELINPLKQGNT